MLLMSQNCHSVQTVIVCNKILTHFIVVAASDNVQRRKNGNVK